jgi:hypothetical protein
VLLASFAASAARFALWSSCTFNFRCEISSAEMMIPPTLP